MMNQFGSMIPVVLAVCVGILGGGCHCMFCSCDEGDVSSVQLIPFSGRFGYGLVGEVYDFTGSLTKNELTDPAWRLEGDFTFPTAGYEVLPPDIRIAESHPEQVTVTLKVNPPSPDSAVAQVITHVPVTADIRASNEAKFSIRIVTLSR